jgi:hypothetical protein
MGIANAFAGGVFLTIALIHIMPEQAEAYEEYKCGEEPNIDCENINDDPDWEAKEFFPLPFFMVFCGYVLILIIDKVMFDTTALFTKPEAEADEQTFADPIENNLRKSISNSLVGSRS